MHLSKGDTAYRARGPADSVYNLVQGVVKTYFIVPDDSISISGFHFAGDLFGLAEEGHYFETAEAIVPSIAFRIPLEALDALLVRNGALGKQLLCKLAHDMRKKQRHTQILARNDALGRVAMFLSMLEELSPQRAPDKSVFLPMSRGDAAQFVGLTLEAMSRASNGLERARVVKFLDRHHFVIADRERFEHLVSGDYHPTVGRAKTPRARSGPAAKKRSK